MAAVSVEIAKKEIAGMLNSDQPSQAKWAEMKAFLSTNKMSYVQSICSDKMLVHPSNRGGLGLSHHNAHKSGSDICKVGENMDLLHSATCMELAVAEESKAKQLKFNRDLVGRSKGLLAPVNGGERFLSLANGHTAAFCKAVLATCTTTQKHLADQTGNLNPSIVGNE